MYSPLVGGGFVQHVALLRSEQELRYDEADVRVWHMGPPLIIGQKSIGLARADASCRAVHVAGIVDLDADDLEGIRTWLAEVEKEDRPYGMTGTPRQYIVKPHVEWARASETGRPLYRKFSCAGFVLECYRAAGVQLVSLPDDTLPEVDLQTVLQAYPAAAVEALRARIGIPGPGPWRILLPGYLFHALDRLTPTTALTGYTPSSAAEAHYG
jgi:hypothetical protein